MYKGDIMKKYIKRLRNRLPYKFTHLRDDVPRTPLEAMEKTFDRVKQESEEINIESIIRTLQRSPDIERDLTFDFSKINEMGTRKLAELMFLQVEKCIHHFGNDIKYDGNSLDAWLEYKTYLESRPGIKARNFALATNQIVDPTVERPENLAVYHYRIIRNIFPEIRLEEWIKGFDDYTDAKTRIERRFKIPSSYVKKERKQSTYRNAVSALVMVTAIVAGWWTINKYVGNPFGIKYTESSDPNSPQDINEPKIVDSNQVAKIPSAKWDRDPKTFDIGGVKYRGVELRYTDTLSHIREHFGKEVDYDNVYIKDGTALLKIPNIDADHKVIPENSIVCWPLPDQTKVVSPK
jgi:hypothetical protein